MQIGKEKVAFKKRCRTAGTEIRQEGNLANKQTESTLAEKKYNKGLPDNPCMVKFAAVSIE